MRSSVKERTTEVGPNINRKYVSVTLHKNKNGRIAKMKQ